MSKFLIKRRAGIIVPPSNPTVEPELHALMDSALSMHIARLPVVAGDLQSRLAAYPGFYRSCFDSFDGLKLDAMFIGVTGSTYAFGAGADRDLCARLSDATGIPVRTASLAILDALEEMDINTITLISPYPDWLTAESVQYWRSGGINVVNVIRAVSASVANAHVYQLTEHDTDDALKQASQNAQSATPVLMTGTGMLTLPTILNNANRMALLSSNLCGAWWLSRQLNLPANEVFAEASPALAQTLGRAGAS